MISHRPFVFIRHGETDWNKQGIVMGQTDIPLNDRGREQAYLASAALKNIAFNSIVASPLSRALETAQIIAEKIKVPVTIIDGLKECCWGDREGTSGNLPLLEEWRKGLRHFEGGETFSCFSKRVLKGLNQALLLPYPILIVAHGGVYRAIQEALQLSFQDLSNGVPLYHRPPEAPTHPWFVYEIGDV